MKAAVAAAQPCRIWTIHLLRVDDYDWAMQYPLYQVDSFTTRPFSGNPAAVCVISEVVPDEWMQNVAMEMNLSETAFIRPLIDQGEHAWELRWFTPNQEVDLCGHATLAAAHVLWETGRVLDTLPVQFCSPRSGALPCVQKEIEGDRWIEMDFPIDVPKATQVATSLIDALGVQPISTHQGKWDPLIELASEQEVLNASPDFRALLDCDMRGVVITARADEANRDRYDFVSRFFAPSCGVDEDPVTGSAHCQLAAFWSERLNQQALVGFQASTRGGIVRVSIEGDRAKIAGQAMLVMEGRLFV